MRSTSSLNSPPEWSHPWELLILTLKHEHNVMINSIVPRIRYVTKLDMFFLKLTSLLNKLIAYSFKFYDIHELLITI
jgi:hypothetical protein